MVVYKYVFFHTLTPTSALCLGKEKEMNGRAHGSRSSAVAVWH